MSDEQKTIFVKQLSARNAETAQEGLRMLDGRISEMHGIIRQQQQGINTLVARISSLEQQITTFRAQAAGHGPTG